jgi:tetratricopeptide (TPR) repeat protein
MERWSSLAHLDKTDNRALADYLRRNRVRFSESDLTSGLLHLREKDVLTPENRFRHPPAEALAAKEPSHRAGTRGIDRGQPDRQPLHRDRTGIQEQRLNIKKPSKVFRRRWRSLPDNIQAQVSIALVIHGPETVRQGCGEFEKALAMDDEDVSARSGLCEAHLALGDAAMTRGRTKEAVLSYQRVLSINAEHTEARGRMAEIARQHAEKALLNGRDEEALSAFTEALRFTPEDPSLIARVEGFRAEKKTKILAILLAASEKEALTKNWDGAVRSLEEALILSPDDETIPRKLADAKAAHAKEGALSAVYAEAQRAYTGKDYDQAVSLFKKIVLEDENYRDASRLLAQAIELRRTAPKWWRRKAPQAKRTPLPRSGPRVSIKKILTIGAASLLVLGLIGGLFWLAQNGLPAIFVPAANKTPTASPPPTGTPDPRVVNPANQHLYLYVDSARTWHEARNYCALQGGYLATIQTATENEFIYQLTGGNSSVWLGATDEAEEGVWSWVTGEPWTYKNWAEGEPNNANEEDVRGENYMSFLWPEAPSYWNDVPAGSAQPFVCEWGPAASDLDPDIHAKLDAIQNWAPIRQTNFDAWEFGDPPQNATLENGKLVLDSENQEHVGVSFDVLPSDSFAVEFEFLISRSGPGSCFFGTDTGGDNDETLKALGLGFDPNSQLHLENYVHPDQWPGFAEASFDDMEPNKVTLIVHGGAITVFVNGILTFDVANPDGNTSYSRHSFSAEGNNACEFDNYRLWNLSEADFSIIQIALDAIQNEAPAYQTSFDTWDFGGLPDYARIDTGKLILASEGEHVSVEIDTVDSDSFGVSFEFLMSDASPEGHCVVYARNEGSGDPERGIVIGFFSNGSWSFALSPQEGTQEDVAYGEFDTTATNKVTLVVIGDQLAVFMNDQPFYSVRDPYGGAVYTYTSFAATYTLTCEYDNYKFWDLSGVDFSTSPETITPAPTTSASQQPAWVTEFAEPILVAISGQPPHVQDDIETATTPWLNYHDGAPFKRIDGEMITSDSNYSWKMWYTDFVIKLDYRFLPSATRDQRWDIGFRGAEGFSFYYGGEVIVNRYLQQAESLARAAEPGGSVNHVLILVKDEAVALFINDQPVYYGDLPSGFKNGEASWFFGSNIAYDNFEIWNLNDLP